MKTITTLAALLLAVSSLARNGHAADTKSAPPSDAVDFFQAVEDHQIDAKFIAKNDHDGRLLITNKTNQPINLKLPEAFAGVPLAQFGGGGGGGRGGGGGGLRWRWWRWPTTKCRRRWRRFGRRWQGGGGGGGFFSVPPEETAKINVRTSSASITACERRTFLRLQDRAGRLSTSIPAVVELLKAFGRGELQHGAVQAAAWHLNNGLSWDELAAKLQGTRRSGPNRPPYFTAADIRAGRPTRAKPRDSPS